MSTRVSYPPLQIYKQTLKKANINIKQGIHMTMRINICLKESSSPSQSFKDDILGNYPHWWADTVATYCLSRR